MNKFINTKLKILILIISIIFSSIKLDAKHKICVIGTGYVGLVTGAVFAQFGNQVICTDIDSNKINQLNSGIIPIYEPKLDEIIKNDTKNNNISFTTDIENSIKKSDIIFITVGTPTEPDGSANLKYIYKAAKIIGKNLNKYKIICTKSTVPIGTNKNILKIIKEYCQDVEFDVISIPEFLREGSAIDDFINPERIVIGLNSNRPLEIINDLYFPYINKNIPFVITDLHTAELIKYASNTFLATKISFINEMADICELAGANITDLTKGMGLDSRIGPKFLSPGPGFGGSCFPKDIKALLHTAKGYGLDLLIADAALKVNENRINKIISKLKNLIGDIENKNIAILGLAFKANTDDIREAPSIKLINKLLELKAKINVYDPMAMPNMKKIIKNINYQNNIESTCKDSHALIILTEWEEFKNMDLENIYNLMQNPAIIDTRNIININKALNIGFKITNIGGAKYNLRNY